MLFADNRARVWRANMVAMADRPNAGAGVRGRLIALFASLILMLPIALDGCRYYGASHASTDSPAQTSVSDATVLWMLKRARQEVEGKPARDAGAAPDEAQRKGAYQVIVSVFNDPSCSKGAAQRSASCLGEGDSLASAVIAAAASLRKQLPARPAKIQIDVISGSFTSIDKPGPENRETAAELLDPGADGLKMADSGKTYYLTPSALIFRGVLSPDPESQPASEFLASACLNFGLSPEGWTAPGVKLWTFRTLSFIEDSSGSRPLRIVRGSVAGIAVDRDHLRAAARLAGDYLIRVQRPDGSFYYYYNPLVDQADLKRYNIIRHEGAASSLFQLYQVTGDAKYLSAAVRAADFVKARIRTFSGLRPKTESNADPGLSKSPSRNGPAAYVASGGDEGRTQLGANGLGLLVIVDEIKYQKKPGDEELAMKLARMILMMQKEDGSFSTSFDSTGDDPGEPPSLYYPGEAMIALMELYGTTGDKRLLDSVRRGADTLMRDEKQQGELPPDAWFAQSLEKLYAVTGERSYAEHALDLAVSMVDSQYAENGPDGYAGGIAPGIPRAVQSASRAEGVLAGYRLAKQLGDHRAEKLLAGLRSSARFEIFQQFTADNSFFLPNPSQAQGGIRESITSMRIRIDYVQHTISSLVGLYSLAD